MYLVQSIVEYLGYAQSYTSKFVEGLEEGKDYYKIKSTLVGHAIRQGKKMAHATKIRMFITKEGLLKVLDIYEDTEEVLWLKSI